MRRITFILVLLIIILSSCAQPVPNMLLGAYELRYNNNPVAALALKADGTFIYVETITEASEYQVRVDGTYQETIEAYNYLKSSGTIDFAVPDDGVPEGIEGLLIPVGSTRYGFYWVTDKDKGTQKITLIGNSSNSNENYTFWYIGSSDSLDSMTSILPDDMRSLMEAMI